MCVVFLVTHGCFVCISLIVVVVAAEFVLLTVVCSSNLACKTGKYRFQAFLLGGCALGGGLLLFS